jgi:hypothetical protein
MEIIQTTLLTMTPNLLLEKQPIIIYDKILNIKNLFDTTFRFSYLFKKEVNISEKTTHQNNSKFAVIHNSKEKNILVIIKKNRIKYNHLNLFYSYLKNTDLFKFDTDLNTITILLEPNTVLIIPFLYSFSSDHTIDVVFLSDFFHTISI